MTLYNLVLLKIAIRRFFAEYLFKQLISLVYSRKHVKDSNETMQDPGQSGRGSVGAGVVVVVVVVVVGRCVVRGGILGNIVILSGIR